ncbi:MAG: DUF4209 domain-containing protein [Geobacter sp.]|nr:DUF4209 domain-containing protein [Geobacter sp.]
MALDHYVSQVHLRNFYSPDLGKRMYAIRKSDLKEFTPKSDDVCRIENGSTNEYLEDERAVEEFLKGIEPNYNSALEKLRANCLDVECIYAIAGFVAYIATCSPTAMRIKSSPLRGVVEETSRILDAKGEFPPPPPELGGKEAETRLSSENPSHMVAASFYENAIQKYRTISKSQRAGYRVDERILELNKLMAESGERSLGEMGVISSPAIDISEIVENARNAVRGKSAIDALLAFANIYKGVRVAKIRDSAQKMLREHPLQALFSSTHMSRDGRVIAKRPGMGLGDSDENEIVLWAEMVKEYGMELGLIVQGDIWPALEILHLEQRLRESDFISICNHSPIVPPGRESLYGKGLFTGYDKDFATAIHLLVPQIENLVRYHLKARGIKTTNLDINGIENENGLSTLIDLPEAKEIFGDDIAFELKALYCDSLGPNLRNEVAHGLLTHDECCSTYSAYAWWLCLKLAFNTFWNARNSMNTPSEKSAGA